MLSLRLSRDLCALVALGTLLIAPFAANTMTDELSPVFCATMISSVIGFMVFDSELRKARREMDSGE